MNCNPASMPAANKACARSVLLFVALLQRCRNSHLHRNGQSKVAGFQFLPARYIIGEGPEPTCIRLSGPKAAPQ
jgi:hypothetical protein